MPDNQTPFEWRKAAGSWFLATLGWGIAWILPFGLLAAASPNSGAFWIGLGSLGLPFISGYLLFRTVARMVTRPWANDEELRVPMTERTSEAETAD